MTDVKKPQNNRIHHYEQVRFTADIAEDGIKKGFLGTVVGSNGNPVESYEVDIGNRPVVTVHASEIELVRPTGKGLDVRAIGPMKIGPPSSFVKEEA